MTLDELSEAVRSVDGLQAIGPKTGAAAARAVLMAVADYFDTLVDNYDGCNKADELRRIAGEG